MAQTAAKCHAKGLGNVVFQQMDIAALPFQDAAFELLGIAASP
jgi:ubiquinone/menaquinone biosynthesis C-methylase UbiE